MDGVLVVAKPVGPTSHDVVGLVRRLAATKRVGHGGTLDPFASGVLPVFLGKATRLVEYHLGDRKRYRATVCFGATSTTDDLEGALSPVPGPPPTRATVETALGGFRGTIEQRPPAYSAIKVAGRRAYAMARAGQAVELAATIGDDRCDRDRRPGTRRPPASRWPSSTSRARRARTSARSPAISGRRWGAAPISARSSGRPAARSRWTRRLDLEAVRAAAEAGPAALAALLRPIDAGLELPTVVVPDVALAAIGRGQAIGVPAGAGTLQEGAPIRLVDEGGRLVAIARLVATKLAPDKVLLDAPAATEPAAHPGVTIRPAQGRAALRPDDGPLLVSIGVFDGLHLGHVWLLEHLVREARLLEAKAGRHHLRRAPGRDPARPGAAAPHGSGGAPRPARGRSASRSS